MIYKFENTAEVGDVIRGYDFRGHDSYIEGEVIEKGMVHGYYAYSINIVKDTAGEGGRVGDVGYIPFESTFDFDGRDEKVS